MFQYNVKRLKEGSLKNVKKRKKNVSNLHITAFMWENHAENHDLAHNQLHTL